MAVGLGACSSPPAGTPIPPRTPFSKMVWNDEFDGPMGASVDKARWHHEIGPWPFNEELQSYTDSPRNIALDGQGNLVITALREAKDGVEYTSARIDTRSSLETTYGRIEARIKMPQGQGLWPAFWMLGNDREEKGWPECGEIDIMEFAGGSPTVITGSLHGP
ncbi:MAG TPA: glycoside hydrolase family 16 protein, partial [Polyangia bacterium]